MVKTNKICKDCGLDKPFEDFRVRKSSKDGLGFTCKECMKKRDKIYYRQYNKHKITTTENKYKKKIYNKTYNYKPENIEKRKQYVEINKDKIRKYNEQYNEHYYSSNIHKYKQHNKEYHLNHKDERKQYNKEYRSKPENVKKRKAYRKNKRNTDLIYNIKCKCRNRIYYALHSQSVIKNNKSIELLGCNYDSYKNYLTNLFTEGMSWEKVLNAEIEIDHIKPLKEFDLTKESEQFKAFNYKNTQPLWKRDNRIKGAKCLDNNQTIYK